MTDLHTEANAILDGPTKTFALSVADILQPVAPPPPPTSGKILFSNDYIGAVPPVYGWDGYYSELSPPPSALVKDGYRPGIPSMRFTFPAGAGSLHCEGLKNWTLLIGEDLYFGVAYKWPTVAEPSPDGWGMIPAQPFYQEFCNSTLALAMHGDKPTEKAHLRMVALTGQQSWTQTPNQAGKGLVREYNNTDGYAQGPSPRAITNLQAGTWYQLIMRVRAAYDHTGLVQIWVKGGQYADWTRTVSELGIPTLQWGISNTGKPLAPTAQHYPVTHKVGDYTGSRTAPHTFEHARCKIGTSLAAVQAAMT